jgi:23S rRNA pseudouridine2605 synthase
MSTSESGDRLQKVLAAAGVGSRRDCEELIREGRVEVDRRVVTELGLRVDPDEQEIRVDGEVVRIARPVYYLVNKPQNVVSTNYDPDGRQRVIDLVPPHKHLFTIGRLDRSSEGLILVTNDGELANRLAHPRYGVPKTYRVEVAGQATLEQLEQLRKGVHLAEGKVQASEVHLKKRLKQSTLVEIVLREGKNREIRRMLARLGHKVLRLKRIALGPLKLGELKAGACRKLDRKEVEALRRASEPGGKSRGETTSPGRAGRSARPRRDKPKAQPKLGKVLTPESGEFIEYREGEESSGGKPRTSAGRPRASGRNAEKRRRPPPQKPRRKKRSR